MPSSEEMAFDPNFSPAGVPAAPNRPVAQERSCTSVILRWLPPSSTGNCTISGYTVEYREEGAPPPLPPLLSSLSPKEVLPSHNTVCFHAFYQLSLLISSNLGLRPGFSCFWSQTPSKIFAKMIITHGRWQSTFTCSYLLNKPDHPDRDNQAHFTGEEAKA